MEKVLVALAGDDEDRKPDGGATSRAERHLARVERTGRVVDRALQQTVHRTPSNLAEDVVTQALRGVGRHLLTRGDKLQQTDTQQSRYST